MHAEVGKEQGKMTYHYIVWMVILNMKIVVGVTNGQSGCNQERNVVEYFWSAAWPLCKRVTH